MATAQKNTTTIADLAITRPNISERVIARVILDRHQKRGRLVEGDVVADIALALTRRNARRVLEAVAGDVLADGLSGQPAEYELARAFLDDIGLSS